MFTKTFWTAVLERALRTAVQAAIVAIGSGSISSTGIDVTRVDWPYVGSIACGGFVLCLLTCLAAQLGTGNGPALTGAEVLRTDTGMAPGPGSSPAPTAPGLDGGRDVQS